MSDIRWDLIPKEIVAIDAYSDFSGSNLYTLDYKGLKRADGGDWDIDILLGVRPSAAVEVVSTLAKRIVSLEYELSVLKKGGNNE